MTEDTEGHIVRLPDDLAAKFREWAGEVVARHGSADVLHRMPWTRDQLTEEECRQWLASREEAACQIDIETCELGRWYANDYDPYGIRNVSEEMYQFGTNRFVRSPESRGWVHEGDLPSPKGGAMYDRVHREWQAYCRANPDDPSVRARRTVKN